MRLKLVLLMLGIAAAELAGVVIYGRPARAEDNSPASAYASCNLVERHTFICQVKVNDAIRRRARVRTEVMRLVGDGKCDEAMKLAIDTNDLDTAAKVKVVCTPAAKPE